MKTWLPTFLICCLLMIGLPLYSQVADRDVTYLDEGKEFYFAFLQNEERTSLCAILQPTSSTQRIFISSRFDSEVEVQFGDDPPAVHSIQAGKTTVLNFPGDRFSCIGDGKCDRIFRVTSEFPVQVSISSQTPLSSEATLVLPVHRWGTEYFSLNYPTDWYNALGNDPQSDSCQLAPRQGEFAIVAAFDSTRVSVRPRVNTLGGLKADSLHTRMLMAGEIWQIQDWGKNRGADDLTGTEIIADRKVGVLTGHVRTGIPYLVQTKNHLLEFLPPVTEAGRLFHAAPLSPMTGENRIRIVSVSGGPNRITLYRGEVDSLEILFETLTARGEFVEYSITGPVRIESTGAVQVGQFSVSEGGGQHGDPSLVMLEPSNHFRTTVGFRPISFLDIHDTTRSEHFGSIVLRGTPDSSIYLDSSPLLGSPRLLEMKSFPGPSGDSTSGYTWLLVSVEDRVEGSFLEGENLKVIAYAAGVTEFDAYATRASTPRIAEDVLASTVQVQTACPAFSAHLTVTDRDRWFSAVDTVMLEGVSENVELISIAGHKGEIMQEYELRQIDSLQPGRAILRTIDLAGNERVDTFELGPYYPRVFSPYPVNQTGGYGNQTQMSEVLFRNEGPEPILVDSIVFRHSRNVTTSQLPINVSPDTVSQITIHFDLSDGSIVDTMRVWAGCRWLDVPIWIEKVDPVGELLAPDFGDVRVGDTAYRSMIVRNLSADTVVFDSIQFGGMGFRLAVPDELPLTVGPNDEGPLLICFSPEIIGFFRESVWVWTDDGSINLSAELAGTGIDSSSSSVFERDRQGNVDIELTTGGLRISLPVPGSVLSVSVYNVLGELVFREEPQRRAVSSLNVPLPEHFPSGVYHVVVNSDSGEVVTHRFSITR